MLRQCVSSYANRKPSEVADGSQLVVGLLTARHAASIASRHSTAMKAFSGIWGASAVLSLLLVKKLAATSANGIRWTQSNAPCRRLLACFLELR